MDFSEKRKAVELFKMDDPHYHDFYKLALKTMRRGDVCWLKVGKGYHRGIYYTTPYYHARTEEQKKEAGDDIWIRFAISNIKRNPVCDDPNTYRGKVEYVNKIRSVCKDLLDEGEPANAQQLYSRCLGDFKNMAKIIRDSLTEE